MTEIIQVDRISKKFCRDLKRSLWYGVKDLTREMTARNGGPRARLRPAEFWALDDVSFEIGAGECVALIGPNGAGKSTLLKLFNGLLKPDRGRITMRGSIGALIELGAGFNPVLTGRENVYVNGAVLGLSKRDTDSKMEQIVEFAELAEFIDSPVQSYSSGMQVRLGYSVAAHLRPQVLLVDEVLAVGDVGFRMKCFKHMAELVAHGTTIVLVSHAVNQLSRIADRAVVLHHGRKVADGPLMDGIARYQQLFAETDAVARPDRGGRPSIQSMRLVGPDGAERQEFETGEELTAEIRINSDRPVSGARLLVALASPTVGVLGSFSTPYTDFLFDVDPPGVTVKLVMPELPLLVGSYQFNVSLYGAETTDFFDRFVQAAGFRVVGPPTDAYGFGVNHVIRFSHRWELDGRE